MMIECTFVLKAITNIIVAFYSKEDILRQNRVIFVTLHIILLLGIGSPERTSYSIEFPGQNFPVFQCSLIPQFPQRWRWRRQAHHLSLCRNIRKLNSLQYSKLPHGKVPMPRGQQKNRIWSTCTVIVVICMLGERVNLLNKILGYYNTFTYYLGCLMFDVFKKSQIKKNMQ